MAEWAQRNAACDATARRPLRRRVLPMTPRVRGVLRTPLDGCWNAGRGLGLARSHQSWAHRSFKPSRSSTQGASEVSGVRPFRALQPSSHFLTRLGDVWVDAWTLASIAGHSSVAISSRDDYIHLPRIAVLEALSRLGGHNSGHNAEYGKLLPVRLERAEMPLDSRELCGERGWTRTIDPCLKRALLCQLSYAPISFETTGLIYHGAGAECRSQPTICARWQIRFRQIHRRCCVRVHRLEVDVKSVSTLQSRGALNKVGANSRTPTPGRYRPFVFFTPYVSSVPQQVSDRVVSG